MGKGQARSVEQHEKKKINLQVKIKEKNPTGQILNKIVEENFPKLKTDTCIQMQEAHRNPPRQNKKRSSSRYIIFKTANIQNEEKNESWKKQKSKSHVNPSELV